MSIPQIRSVLRDIEHNAALFKEQNFDQRAEAIDFLGFHVIEPSRAPGESTLPGEWRSLIDQAKILKAALEKIDVNLFQKLTANIRTGKLGGKAFERLVNEYFDMGAENGQPGYDNLDLFINRLFPFDHAPEQTKPLEPGMVYYQKTPARVVFELAKKCQFTKDDVFVDLGSGFGQAVILVNLLTGVKAKGIEFEPAFCLYARECARAFNLPGVDFIHVDARRADYSEGTVFFMYTPFMGEMLEEVLAMLRKESRQRPIRIITYGPCTEHVAMQKWLHSAGQPGNNFYMLTFFDSF